MGDWADDRAAEFLRMVPKLPADDQRSWLAQALRLAHAEGELDATMDIYRAREHERVRK